MTLTEFLLDRIDEDKSAVESTLEASSRPTEPGHEWTAQYDSRYGVFDPEIVMQTGRALAECEAKRRIVERCRPLVAVTYRESDRLLASAFNETRVPILAHSDPIWPNEDAEATLRDLALPYRDHPDYDEAWRP